MELIRRDYAANGGWETFLSYEDPRQDVLVGLLRLRQVSSHNQQDRQPELRGRWAAGSSWLQLYQLHTVASAVMCLSDLFDLLPCSLAEGTHSISHLPLPLLS